MKIGINARFLTHPHTGIGQYTHYLLRSLAAADAGNEYFLFSPEAVALKLPDNFHFIRVPERSGSPSWAKAHWEHRLVPQEMEKWKVDLAHFLYPANPWRKLPFPAVVTVHDVIPWKLPAYRQSLRSRLYHFYARRALKKADHLITVSEFSKTEIKQLFKVPDKHITVIPHGLPLPSGELPLPDVPLRRDFVLYVGGYDERKNVPALIQAFLKHVVNRHPIDLILVNGKGRGLEAFLTDEHAHRLTADIPLQPKGGVVFTGPLSDAELQALYKQALMLAHPSTYEGFNLPLIEAMSFGTPIAAADIPVNREVTGEAALFFDPHSIDAIGAAILRLLNDKKTRAQLSAYGHARAADYSWERSAKQTLGVYNLFNR